MSSEPRYIPGYGNRDAAIMFVGEAPGESEDYTGIPFSGASGELLWEVCREIGIEKSEVYTTNVVKYRPPGNQLKRLPEININIEDQIQQLWDEIHEIKPNIIVALGNTPLRALTGKDKILKWRGSLLRSKNLDYKVLAAIHPAAFLHSIENEYAGGEKKGPLKYSWRHILKLDLLRAIKHSYDRSYDPPGRVLEIAKDSIMLGRFLDLYADRTKYPIVSVDIEVTRSIPFCVGLAFNNWHAISVPLLNIYSWRNEDGITDHELAYMWILIAELLGSDVKVIGQNFKFDQGQLKNLLGIRISNFYCDTSLLAHALHPEFPKALEFTTSIYTEEPYYKEEGKEFNWQKDDASRVLLYNARDAVVTYEVYEQMLIDAKDLQVPGFPNWVDEFIFAHQMALHPFYCDMEDVGFRVDSTKQAELIELYERRVKESQAELNELVGWEVNTASPKQVAVLVYNQLKYPQRMGASEDVLIALMANTRNQTAKGKRALELVLWIRRLRLAQVKIGRRPDYDGRMRSVFTICGTETGRSSTHIQKPPVRHTKMGTEYHTLTKHGDIGTEVREMFIADDGYVIVETDMSQAEARIVALLANDLAVLKLFQHKQDVHRLTASWIFSLKVDQVRKEERFIGKMCRHAGNYNLKKHRLMEMVNTEAKRQHLNVNLSEWKAGKILDAFHQYSPNIRKVFHYEVQQVLQNNNRILVNPFGRVRQFFDRWGDELFREAYAQLPQSTVPDHLRRAGLRAKQRFVDTHISARFVVEAHDALVGLVREADVPRYIAILHEEIMVPIDFSRCTIQRGLLTIPAESKVGYTYKTCEDKLCKGSAQGCRNLHDYVAIAMPST